MQAATKPGFQTSRGVPNGTRGFQRVQHTYQKIRELLRIIPSMAQRLVLWMGRCVGVVYADQESLLHRSVHARRRTARGSDLHAAEVKRSAEGTRGSRVDRGTGEAIKGS